MGWTEKMLIALGGAAPTDLTLIDGVKDSGLGIAGIPIQPDSCYVEIYVESLRLEKARKFVTEFDGIIYSFVSTSRSGANRTTVAGVTKPQNLSSLDSRNIGRVITVSKRILPATPWRGNPISVELGLFSVKSGNIMSPLVNYVAKISDRIGVGVIPNIDSYLPLITEGLDLIAGQSQDTELELAIDTDLAVSESRLYAILTAKKGSIDHTAISIDPVDRKLLIGGKPLDCGYCLFSIRWSEKNPDWGSITLLRDAYAEFVKSVQTGKHKEAGEALAAFNRQVSICPDLISVDKRRLKTLVDSEFRDAFAGGGQSADAKEAGSNPAKEEFNNPGGRVLSDLNLYGS